VMGCEDAATNLKQEVLENELSRIEAQRMVLRGTQSRYEKLAHLLGKRHLLAGLVNPYVPAGRASGVGKGDLAGRAAHAAGGLSLHH
jgi:hypothetical protein